MKSPADYVYRLTLWLHFYCNLQVWCSFSKKATSSVNGDEDEDEDEDESDDDDDNDDVCCSDLILTSLTHTK